MDPKNAEYSISVVFLLSIKNGFVSKIDGKITLDGEILLRLTCDIKSSIESWRIKEQMYDSFSPS